jgi:Cft2 family RNA processing exonuclease
LEDWQDLYTEADIIDCFENYVVVLNHNENHVHDSLVKLTPVSSGFHIGSSCWMLEIAHMKISVLTNASVGVDYRHPKKFAPELLEDSDVMLLAGIASKPDQLPYY